jgi:hypothetical protein
MSNYDNWKTTDRNYERQCEAQEEAEEIISNNGCDECGNNDPEGFEEIELENYKLGKYDCIRVSAVCERCGTEFGYACEPDFDSMRERY